MAEDQPEQQPQQRAEPQVSYYYTFQRDGRRDIVFSDRGTATLVLGSIADVEETIASLKDIVQQAKYGDKRGR